MFKIFIAKLFGLTDITKQLTLTREDQKKIDKNFWEKKLKKEKLKIEREYELKLQSVLSENILLQQELQSYEREKNNIDTAKHYVRKKAKDNALMSATISHKVKELTYNITKLSEEIDGLKITSEKDLQKIEKRILREG